jgi:hypothetical protein
MSSPHNSKEGTREICLTKRAFDRKLLTAFAFQLVSKTYALSKTYKSHVDLISDEPMDGWLVEIDLPFHN